MASASIKRLLHNAVGSRSSLCMCQYTWRQNQLEDLTRKSMATTSSSPAAETKTQLTPADSDVILERIGNKGVITLNRPKQLNALSLSMIRTIYPLLRKWEMDSSLKMVICKAVGDKAFCAGGDVKTIALEGKGSKLSDEFFREEYRLNNAIGSFSVPTVILIDGIVMGGGVGLSVHAAFRVATEKSTFAMPETAIGFFPDVGTSHFLSRLPGKFGLFLALTGHRVFGRDTFKAGVATHFVTSDKLQHLEADLMRIQSPDLPSIDKILTKYQEQWEIDYKKEFSLKPYIGRINSCFGQANSVEDIMENLRKDQSDWANKQVEALEKMSPTSLKVTYELLKRGASLTLPECLKMEFRLSQRFMQGHDFYEGIRAVLIDRDNKPKWNPPTLEEVTADQVQAYFEPLGTELQL